MPAVDMQHSILQTLMLNYHRADHCVCPTVEGKLLEQPSN